MKQLAHWILLGLLAVSMAACSDLKMPSFGGGGDTVDVKKQRKSSDGPLLKYAAGIRILRYVDDRKTGSPRKIGIATEAVSGMSGKDIILNQDVSTMVADAVKIKLDEAGFQVSEAEVGNAQFELSGVIKQLTYDVKVRDEISIVVETSLKEISTGKVIWSAIVTEKTDRFAGVAGNNMDDIARYLRKELGIVAQKTTDAISATLLAVHPELFNLVPGTKPIPGVTVLVAPTVERPAAAPGQMRAVPAAPSPETYTTYTPHASDTHGLVLVNTNPTRAKVYLDSVYFGLSPLRLELDPGIHTISVKLPGYKMVAEKISVRKGDSTELDLDLER